jgi:GLPGLI family protein
MKDMLENVYELDFNAATSLYKKEEKLEQPGQGGGRGFMASLDGGTLFKDTKSKTFIQAQDLMGKLFLVKDSLILLSWEFKDDSKMIGKHLCFKATAKKTVANNQFRFGSRGSHNDGKPKDSLKEIEVVAWYTPEIPVRHGPGQYWGLPGLILEINADKTQIVCTKIVINPKEKAEIKAPKKGTVIGQKEFDEIRIKKMKEMQEMFEGRRRDGQGGGHR